MCILITVIKMCVDAISQVMEALDQALMADMEVRTHVTFGIRWLVCNVCLSVCVCLSIGHCGEAA
jgi:hypothetical protein